MLLEKFKNFIESNSDEMYISGQAGTGKTTALKQLVEYCEESNIDYIATAFTHKAVKVLKDKLPDNANCNTIHGFLKKIPFDNDEALKVSHITNNKQIKEPQDYDLVFFDEFSMIGKKDKFAIDNLRAKKIFIGDPNQLLPVNDKPAIKPVGDFNIVLTKVWRQKDSNDLLDNLTLLNKSIKARVVPNLKWGDNLIKIKNIQKVYKSLNQCKVLSWTNKNVQELNAILEGKTKPKPGDRIFCQTVNRVYTLIEEINFEQLEYIIDNSDQYVKKFKSIQNDLNKLKNYSFIKFYRLLSDSGFETIRAGIFGHGDYNDLLNKYAAHGVKLNNQIIKLSKDINGYLKYNPNGYLTKQRNAAWNTYKLFKVNVACFDFVHAMTIHKSQGSTYENVIINLQDLKKLKQKQIENYLRLIYVGLSRASKKAYIYLGE